MTRQLFRSGAALALLLVSAAAYADDPTGVLLSEQRANLPALRHSGQLPAFSDVGPCQPGTQSVAFPNSQGFRCVPERD